MSILTTTSRRNTNTNNNEPKPFDGCWINVGIKSKVEEEDGTIVERLVKFPLGIPVDSLKDRKVYPGTNPEYANESDQINSIMELIREKAESLEPGESAPLALAVEVYRKQDEASAPPVARADREALSEALFGN